MSRTALFFELLIVVVVLGALSIAAAVLRNVGLG
jgi:hypothetical protein